jgi:hypothetical protein
LGPFFIVRLTNPLQLAFQEGKEKAGVWWVLE